MQVYHRKNEDEISILGKDYATWKTPDLASTYVVFENGPGVWKTQDFFYRGVNFDGEIVTKTRLATFIIFYGIEKFRLSFRMKPILRNCSTPHGSVLAKGLIGL